MNKKLLLFALSLICFFGVQAQTTVTVTATGAAGSYNTGSVNSAGTKNDGNMTTINSSSNAGWAMFDLSTIPAGAIVMSANCIFTTYSSTSSSATNNLYGFVGTPSSMAGTALYTSCTSGTSLNASTWTANATLTKALNATGLTFLQTNIPASNVCIGFARGSTNTYNIYGYPGAAGQQPQLVITYSLQPACSGVPSAGSAVASATQVCAPQTVNLSLTGVTAASGLTYQWESSPNGTAWTAIPSATNAITSQTGSGTTYFHCVVACGSNTAASTPVTVNYSATPVAGSTAASNTLACVGQAITFTLTGSTSYPGMTYQWQSSPNGTTWTSIPSATAATTSQSVSTATYYQAVLSCGTGTASSTPVQVTMVTPVTYTNTPYLEAFDNTWQSRCDNHNVPVAANWSSSPSTGNNSWRRQDDGTTANWTSATTGIVTPMGTGSANFHSYYASSGTVGNLDLYINMGTTQNYVMSFYNYNQSGSDSLRVFLSTDGGSTFSFKGSYGNAANWTQQLITLGAVNSPSCVVRFSAISDYGADDIGLDSLKIFTAACSTPPVAGTISGPTTVTVNTTSTYTVSPAVGNLQWYASSSATGPWSAIPTATDAVQALTASSGGTFYVTVVASSVGCLNDTSNVPLAISVNFPGDDVCNAIPLGFGDVTYYYPAGASVQTGEVAPPGTGCQTNSSWCNNTLNNSMWFSFTAPASGYVSVNSPGFDTQLALWKASSCGDLLSASTATLMAANDDDPNYTTHGGVNYSSYLEAACLTPGATYYIQLDSYSAASSTDSTQVIITDMGVLDMGFTGLSANYCLPTAASASLTPNVNGGVFSLNTATNVVTAFTPSVSGVGTYTVSYSYLGCTSNSITTVANTPSVTASSSASVICMGGSVFLSGSGATSYTWMPGGQTTASVTGTPTITTTYTLTGSSSGCSSTGNVNVTVTPNTTVTISAPSIVCTSQSTTLTATGAANYTWSPGGQTTPSIVVTPTASATYTVMGDNTCGINMASATVSVTSTPVVNASSTNTMLCSGQSATLTASGSASYTWAPGGQTTASIVVTPTTTITYTLTGTSSCGTATTVVTENVSICTGIEALTGSVVTLFPNPNHGQVTITVSSELIGTSSVEVYDALGKLVIREKISSGTTQLSTAQLNDGFYIYKIVSEGQIVKTGRMIKQ